MNLPVSVFQEVIKNFVFALICSLGTLQRKTIYICDSKTFKMRFYEISKNVKDFAKSTIVLSVHYISNFTKSLVLKFCCYTSIYCIYIFQYCLGFLVQCSITRLERVYLYLCVISLVMKVLKYNVSSKSLMMMIFYSRLVTIFKYTQCTLSKA